MRVLTLVVGVLFCSAMAVVAARWGLADSHFNLVHREMQKWDKSGVPEEGWLLAFAEMQKALELDPDHPVYLQRISRLLAIRMRMKPEEARPLGVKGLKYIERSLEIRPQWPGAWAGLAILKYQLRDYDARFNEAVVNATMYGPWESAVLSQMTAVGIGSWEHLPDATRTVVLGNIGRGLRSPVPGVPAVIVGLINDNLKNFEAGFLHGLGDQLVSVEWTKNGQAAMAGLAVQHWELFTPEQQQVLGIKLARVNGKGAGYNR